jgi:hypothetical protein
MKTSHVLLMGIAAGGGMPAATAGAQEMSKDIIAVQIRKQGFECKNPESATRDPAASKPDDAAWILRCEGITYKVQLVPNQAAKVERVPDDQKTTQQP